MEIRWGVWRSDGEWMRKRGSTAPWIAESFDDADREAKEMCAFAFDNGSDHRFEARKLP